MKNVFQAGAAGPRAGAASRGLGGCELCLGAAF